MTWTSTAPVLVKILLIVAVIICRFFRPPQPPTLVENIVHTIVFLAAFWTFWGSIIEYLVVSSLNLTGIVLRMDLVPQYGNMFLVIVASCWLLYRSAQTLRIPVPDLIDILKVDVPEAPDVSLAGIRSDAATLEWSRPPNSRPVQKYVIQVNGVNVGHSTPQDTAITVTGLKPAHFYNIRVIAVGSNNFQSGSPVIRLRTYGKDGRPQLINGRLPMSFVDQENIKRKEDGQDDGLEPPRSPVPSIEATHAVDSSATRDAVPSAVSHRRNTVSRRHSPSTTSLDQPLPPKDNKSARSTESQESLAELNGRFQRIRKEIADTLAQYEREEADFKQQEGQLRKDLEQKRQTLKEKETNTEQLRKRVNVTGEQMRAAEKERAKKEQLLKDKKAKLAATRDHIAKLEAETESMRAKREGFTEKKAELDEYRDTKVAALTKENSELQEECSKLEAELKEKGRLLKELKQERQKLPGGDADERWKETDIQLKKEWESRRRMLEQRIASEMQRRNDLTHNIRLVHNLIEQYRAHQSTLANPYLQSNASGVDFVDATQQQLQNQIKRHSRHSNSFPGVPLPAHSQFPLPESTYVTSSGFGSRASFAPGPYVDVSTTADSFGHDQAFNAADNHPLSAGAPLSPTATSLIPAGILVDDDSPHAPPLSPPTDAHSPLRRPTSAAVMDTDPQSPASSSRSLSIISSPHSSSQHLPFPQLSSEPGDRRSRDIGKGTSPPAPAVQPSRFTNLFSPFQRARGTAKMAEEMGPPLGTLKPGQSRSFPRQTDEWDTVGNKRKVSIATSLFNRNSVHGENGETLAGNSISSSARRLNPFASSQGASMMAGISQGDPSSPRPASIASTDRESIWGPGDSGLLKNRLWTSSDGRWPSRNPSRRPSLHGQTTATETTLASPDDEILDEEALLNPETSPSQVGVIGSRPPGSRASMAQRLNPKAPTFMTSLFRKPDKDGKEKSEGKGKGKDKTKDKTPSSAGEAMSSQASAADDCSPSDSRKSRDTFSLHTQTSVSESRESLNLDSTLSNPVSEPGAGSGSTDNVVRKLFRKGSSSRFNLSSRLGKDSGASGLFKKGGSGAPPGTSASVSSAAGSDKNVNLSAGRSSLGDADDIGDADGGIVLLGRSYDSAASGGGSPYLGPAKSRDSGGGGAREAAGSSSRMSSWRFSMKKKGKDARDSLDLERKGSLVPESEGTGDEERK